MAHNFSNRSFTRYGLVLGLFATASAALAAATTYIDTSTQKESGFSNAQLTPFKLDTYNTIKGNYVQPFSKSGEPAIKTYWAQASYDGTRGTKGAEIKSPDDFKLYSDGWYGFRFLLPATPTDKEYGIGQIFSRGGCKSWSALLVVKNNSLILRSRSSNGCTAEVDQVVSTNIQRDVWHNVIIRFKASAANAGELKLWYDGAAQANPTTIRSNIKFGAGTFVAAADKLDDSVADNFIFYKLGQYDFDVANYTTGETRVVYYDDVSMLSGNPAGAFELVNPDQTG